MKLQESRRLALSAMEDKDDRKRFVIFLEVDK